MQAARVAYKYRLIGLIKCAQHTAFRRDSPRTATTITTVRDTRYYGCYSSTTTTAAAAAAISPGSHFGPQYTADMLRQCRASFDDRIGMPCG